MNRRPASRIANLHSPTANLAEGSCGAICEPGSIRGPARTFSEDFNLEHSTPSRADARFAISAVADSPQAVPKKTAGARDAHTPSCVYLG